MFARTVFVSNLVAGTAVAGVVALGSWPLGLVAMAYVVAVASLLAIAYARPMSRRVELAVWLAPWFGAVALVTLLYPVGWAVPLYAAVYLLPVHLAWQVLALALRQGMAWVSSRGRTVGGA